MSKRQELTCEFSQHNGIFKLNDDINGKIIVQPLSHISFYKVVFEIYWSIFNGSKTEETLLKKQEYATQRKDWEAGKRYELNFSFKSQAPLSFSSKILSIKRFLKVRVIKHESGWSLGKNHPDYQSTYTFPYVLNPSPDSYQISKTNRDINYNGFIPSLVIPIAIGLTGSFVGFPLIDFLSAGAFGGGLYYTFVGFGKLGKVNIVASPFDDTHFQVQLNIQRSWSNISKIELAHIVHSISRYKDRSQSITQHYPITKLSYQDFDTIDNPNLTIVRSYHSVNLPPTLISKYFEIQWKLELIIHLKNKKKKQIRLEMPMNIIAR